MRLFAAVYPSAEAVAELGALLGRSRTSTAGWQVRWAPADQWHLTVAFFGEVPARALTDLSSRLARAAARAAPASLSVGGLGAFPRRSGVGATVLWAGLLGDLDGLRLLGRSVAAAGDRSIPGAGSGRSTHRFRPHITVARCRSPGGADLSAMVAATADHVGPSWRVDSLVLVRSHLGAEVRHERIGAWPLGRVDTGLQHPDVSP